MCNHFFDKIKDKDELEVIVSQFVINRILQNKTCLLIV